MSVDMKLFSLMESTRSCISKYSLYTGLLKFLLFPYRNAAIAVRQYLWLDIRFLFINIKILRGSVGYLSNILNRLQDCQAIRLKQRRFQSSNIIVPFKISLIL